MITAFEARKTSTEAQLRLAEDFIKTAIDLGFKSICISDELNETLYCEVINSLLDQGFDIIYKVYSTQINTIVSWENGKEKDGIEITIDCRLSDNDDEFISEGTCSYEDDNDNDITDYDES